MGEEPTEAEYKEMEVIEEIMKYRDPAKENDTLSETSEVSVARSEDFAIFRFPARQSTAAEKDLEKVLKEQSLSVSETQKPMDVKIQREEKRINVSIATIPLPTVFEEETLDGDQGRTASSQSTQIQAPHSAKPSAITSGSLGEVTKSANLGVLPEVFDERRREERVRQQRLAGGRKSKPHEPNYQFTVNNFFSTTSERYKNEARLQREGPVRHLGAIPKAPLPFSPTYVDARERIKQKQSSSDKHGQEPKAERV